ncbi:MAG: NUDIX domain-containing protein [Candidatus Micrarchaeaceae archaeon]
MVHESSLCYVIENGKVLMQLKGIGTQYVGRWVAPGGEILDGDSPKASAARWTREQTGLEVTEMHLLGNIICLVNNNIDRIVYVFRADSFKGSVAGTGGILQWFEKGKMPKGSTFYSDEIWSNMVFDGKKFSCKLYFSKDYIALLKSEIV